MIRKLAAVVAFGVGAYFGYRWALQIIDFYAYNFEGYWGELGAQSVRTVMPLAIGGFAAAVIYWAINLFARAD